MRTSFKDNVKLSFIEEVLNCATHGTGALLMLILLPVTAVFAYKRFGSSAAFSMSVFVTSLFMMFLASTFYHSMEFGTIRKYVLRKIDHSMIYLAIAGSYTPVLLNLVGGTKGIVLLIIQWSLTLFGIIYKSAFKNINEKFSMFLYIAMGWMAIFIIPTMIRKSSVAFIALIVSGGLCYTIGSYFYTRKKPYYHFVWHIFILIAAILQYIGIVFFMIK